MNTNALLLKLHQVGTGFAWHTLALTLVPWLVPALGFIPAVGLVLTAAGPMPYAAKLLSVVLTVLCVFSLVFASYANHLKNRRQAQSQATFWTKGVAGPEHNEPPYSWVERNTYRLCFVLGLYLGGLMVVLARRAPTEKLQEELAVVALCVLPATWLLAHSLCWWSIPASLALLVACLSADMLTLFRHGWVNDEEWAYAGTRWSSLPSGARAFAHRGYHGFFAHQRVVEPLPAEFSAEEDDDYDSYDE